VPAEIKKNMELWVGCVAGALSDYECVAKLAKAGFDNIDIEPTRVYSIEDARAFLSGRGPISLVRWDRRNIFDLTGRYSKLG
jgi:arsenite methyltransferase